MSNFEPASRVMFSLRGEFETHHSAAETSTLLQCTAYSTDFDAS